jgi:hypothetical protein
MAGSQRFGFGSSDLFWISDFEVVGLGWFAAGAPLAQSRPHSYAGAGGM